MAKARDSEKRKMYKGWANLTGEALKGERDRLRVREEQALKNAGGKPTNEAFAVTDQAFKDACEKAGVPATARQASKFRRKRGLAYTKGS